MKYIETYKVFELNEVDIVNDIEDILLYLDDDLEGSVQKLPYYLLNDGNEIEYDVKIYKNQNQYRRQLKLNDELIDIIIRLNDYMSMCGFKSELFYLGNSTYNRFFIDGDKLRQKGAIIPDEYSPFIFHIKLSFFKKQ